MPEPLRIGTRASALALRQTESVRDRLAAAGWQSRRVEITTTGDIVRDVPLSRIGTVALFTRQLDEAMLAGRIDIAVHSLKDLPTQLPDGIEIAAIGAREDPRDALVSREPLAWADLAAGAVLATSSLRRRAQLLHARSDLEIIDIRGNVDTRLAKLDANPGWTAVVLAVAGLTRLGLEARITERLPLGVMLPAPGQGALAATVRSGDDRARAALRTALHDSATARAVLAERGFLRRLEGGCQVPIAAHAELRDGQLTFRGRVAALDGSAVVDVERSAAVASDDEAGAFGVLAAEEALARGADRILEQVRTSGPRPAGFEA